MNSKAKRKQRAAMREANMCARYDTRAKLSVRNAYICERGFFAQCKGVRAPKKARNTFSGDEAGRCAPSHLRTIRWANSYATSICRSTKIYV